MNLPLADPGIEVAGSGTPTAKPDVEVCGALAVTGAPIDQFLGAGAAALAGDGALHVWSTRAHLAMPRRPTPPVRPTHPTAEAIGW